MKNLLSYLLLFLILFLLAVNHATAQDDATTKFIDSVSKSQPVTHDSIVSYDSTATDEESSDSTYEAMPIDTAITSRIININADTIHLIKKDKGFYYQQYLDSLLRADESNGKKAEEPAKKIDLSGLDVFFTIFKIILWVLAVAVVAFVLYRLFIGKNALFVGNRKNIEANIQLQEEVVSADQYDALIRKAENGNDFRLAVRYRYLQLLRNLSEKGYIQYGTEKTNYQYLNEMRKRSSKAANLFSAITLKYEYSWYGEYVVSNSMYALLQRDFINLNQETSA